MKTCPYCGKIFTSENDIAIHIINNHYDTSDIDPIFLWEED